MTIKKGSNWGSTVARPIDLVTCQSDLEASKLLTEHYLQKKPFPAIAISRSNLARALGTKGASASNQTMHATPFDLIEISFVDASNAKQTVLALGYGLVCKSWWRGEIAATMNTSFVDNWDCAPRSHPNDGKFDLLTVANEMSVSQRLIASRRLRFGTHIPHPQISVKQMTYFETQCPTRPDLYIDDQKFSSVRSCSFKIMPDAITLYW